MPFNRTTGRRIDSVRGRIVLIVLIGAALPLGLLGAWLTRSSIRAAEDLLRGELRHSLGSAAAGIHDRWEERHAALELLAGNQPLIDALTGGQLDSTAKTFLDAVYAQLGPRVVRAVIRDRAGRERWRAGDDGGRFRAEGGGVQLPDTNTLPVRIAIRDGERGDTLGTLDVALSVQAVLPGATIPSAPAGSVAAIYDRATRLSLSPDSLGRDRLSASTFRYGDATWVVERESVAEPALDLYLASSLDPYVGPHRRAARIGALALVAVIGLGLLITLYMSGRLARSLEALAGAADAVAGGRLDQHVEVGGPDEVARVAVAFNTMTTNLRSTLDVMARRESLAAVGEFAASLAHEIRNGHTAARVDLQRALRRIADGEPAAPLAERALQRITRLDHTVTASLRLARSGAIDASAVVLRDPLARAVEHARIEGDARGVAVHDANGDDSNARVNGDAAALEALFVNLLLNGVDATARDGRVMVSVSTADDWAEVRIRDSGNGVATADLSRAFEPLYSTKPGGTGLGLPIARRIAEAHGGEITLAREGGGTCAVVRLPVSRAGEQAG